MSLDSSLDARYEDLLQFSKSWDDLVYSGTCGTGRYSSNRPLGVTPILSTTYGLANGPLATDIAGVKFDLTRDPSALAIVRRISRESTHVARAIRANVATLDKNKLQRGIRIRSTRPLDLGSLRTLKVLLLENPGIGVSWECDEPIDGELQLIHREASWGSIEQIQLTGDADPEFDLAVEQDLVNLAYGRIVRSVSDRVKQPVSYRAARSIGLACANSGHGRLALDFLSRAASHPGVEPGFRAHLQYLCSLILAKRLEDVEESDRVLSEANHSLSSSGAQESLEQSWLHNGMALNAALRYRIDGSGESLEQCFRSVTAAIRLIEGRRDDAGLYLRFNLLANTVFLHQIAGRFETASSLWERSFSGLSSTTRSGPYWFRYSHLKILTEEWEVASSASEKAARALVAEPWSLLRVCDQQLFIARAIGDFSNVADIATTAASAALSLGDAAAYQRYLELVGGDLSSLDWLVLHPKLPAYVPSIDLLDAPKRDLNQVLSGETSSQRMASSRD